MATTLGVCESFLAQAIQGRLPERTAEQRERLRVHRRFFTALALHDLVHEAPILYVAGKYSVSKGLLQTLQSAAGMFSGMVTVFCARLGWKNMELLLSQFQSRLSFGVERELCDLVRISLVNGFRARALYNAGFHTLSGLATTNPLAVEHCLRNSVPFRSSKAESGESGSEGGTTWCGRLRRGMTECEAAREIVHEAQRILSEQMNLPITAWRTIQHQPNQQQPHTVHHRPHTATHLQPNTDTAGPTAHSDELKEEGLREPPSSKRIKSSISGDSARTDAPKHSNATTHKSTVIFKTPKNPRKTLCRRKTASKPESIGAKFTSSPVISLCRVTTTSARPSSTTARQTENKLPEPLPIIPKLDLSGEDDSISYSPLFSPDTSGFYLKSPSRSLLHTPLPLEHFQHDSQHDSPHRNKVTNTPSFMKPDSNCQNKVPDTPTTGELDTSDHPITVPNSLPCSLDMSTGFSRSTLAMIDAACEAVDMSCSIITEHNTHGHVEADLVEGEAGLVEGGLVEGEAGLVVGQAGLVKASPVDANLAEAELVEVEREGVVKVAESPLVLNQNPAEEFTAPASTPAKPDKSKSESSTAGNSENSHTEPPKLVTGTPNVMTQSRLRDLSLHSQLPLSQCGACIIEVTSNTLLFQTFISECVEQTSISFSLAVTSFSRDQAIGVKIVDEEVVQGLPIPHQSEQVVGVAFTWGNTDAYYVSLSQEEHENCISLNSRIEAVKSIFQSQNCREMMAYSLKRHLMVLVSVFRMVPSALCIDPLVGDWLLNPDGREKTLHKMVLHYLPEQPQLCEGEDQDELPLTTLATHGSQPHLRAAAESILASLLVSKLRPLLQEEGLLQPLLEVEMPSLVALTKAEINGIGFSRDDCRAFKELLQLRLSQIESEAYTHAGRSFSLTSPEDVSRVLFLELQLPPPCDGKQQKTLGLNRRAKRRVQHLSTAKDVLEKLTSVHPLPGLILEWRRVSATVTKTVFPLFKDAVYHPTLDSVRIHSTYHIHTATGRVATSDPNLQMVPKEYHIGTKSSVAAMLESHEISSEISSLVSESQCYRDASNSQQTREDRSSKHHKNTEHRPVKSAVNMRSVFVPFPGGVFLAADYSQLELRILGHMSGDSKLQQVLNSEGDVFRMIAGEWLGVSVDQVTQEDRQTAKQICYGMVYGIGAKALSEQLNIAQEDAARFMDGFKSKYPTMKKFITDTLQSCRENGYIVTLLGRKRYLSGIHSQNVHARHQAERQAVNSTIQGSAADLVKTATINIDRILTSEYNSSILTLSTPSEGEVHRDRRVRGAYLVLQLHDELLYEVNESDLPRVAQIVRQEMENALRLSVKFPVKMKVGTSWGHLTEYTPPFSS